MKIYDHSAKVAHHFISQRPTIKQKWWSSCWRAALMLRLGGKLAPKFGGIGLQTGWWFRITSTCYTLSWVILIAVMSININIHTTMMLSSKLCVLKMRMTIFNNWWQNVDSCCSDVLQIFVVWTETSKTDQIWGRTTLAFLLRFGWVYALGTTTHTTSFAISFHQVQFGVCCHFLGQ